MLSKGSHVSRSIPYPILRAAPESVSRRGRWSNEVISHRTMVQDARHSELIRPGRHLDQGRRGERWRGSSKAPTLLERPSEASARSAGLLCPACAKQGVELP